MDRNLEFLDRLCTRMTEMGLAYGDGEFSEKWLGRGQPYLRSSKEIGRVVPDKIVARAGEQILSKARATKYQLDDITQRYRHFEELLVMLEVHRLEGEMPRDGGIDSERPDMKEPQGPADQIRVFLDRVKQLERFEK